MNIGLFKVTIKAEKGSKLTTGGKKYLFKNSINVSSTGCEFFLIDAIKEKINELIVPNLKKKVEIFKQKFGKAVINGSVTTKVELGKLIL